MAGPLLKRANTIVWLPPRGDGRTLPASDARLLAFARGPRGWSLTHASFDALAARRSVVLLVDPRDVALLAPRLPPLTGARLARALPNAVEDMLLQDPSGCVLALGPALDGEGTRLVAACDRAWLEAVVVAVERRGLSVAGIWPAALTLPVQAGGWTLACVRDVLALRRGEADAIGWPAGLDAQQRADSVAALLQAAVRDGAPAVPLRVLIDDEQWRAPVEQALARLGREAASIEPLPAPVAAPVDLLPPLRGRLRAASLGRGDWRPWRWPAALAAACVVASVGGLNLHWARLANEHAALKAATERGFRQAVPTATVVVDPLLQLRRHVTDLRTRSGTAAPDDFMPLLARFAKALGPGGDDAVGSFEYRDGALRVRMRPGRADSDAARETLRAACEQAGLTVRFDSGADPVAIVRVRA